MNSFTPITLIYEQGMKRILLPGKVAHFDEPPPLLLAPVIGRKLIKMVLRSF